MQHEPKTDQQLLERLHTAAKQPMSNEELRKQRVSFVYGNLPADSSMTRHQVMVTLDRLEGVAA